MKQPSTCSVAPNRLPPASVSAVAAGLGVPPALVCKGCLLLRSQRCRAGLMVRFCTRCQPNRCKLLPPRSALVRSNAVICKLGIDALRLPCPAACAAACGDRLLAGGLFIDDAPLALAPGTYTRLLVRDAVLLRQSGGGAVSEARAAGRAACCGKSAQNLQALFICSVANYLCPRAAAPTVRGRFPPARGPTSPWRAPRCWPPPPPLHQRAGPAHLSPWRCWPGTAEQNAASFPRQGAAAL